MWVLYPLTKGELEIGTDFSLSYFSRKVSDLELEAGSTYLPIPSPPLPCYLCCYTNNGEILYICICPFGEFWDAACCRLLFQYYQCYTKNNNNEIYIFVCVCGATAS